LALKNGSSVTVGGRDVAILLAAFEEVNKCTLSLCLGTALRSGQSDLVMIASASTNPPVGVDPVLLACERFSLSQQGFVTIESAIMFALYQIDFALAGREFEETRKK
jgi:hypothetical protein